MVRKVAPLGLAILVLSALSTNLAAGARTEVCKARCLQDLISALEERVDDLEDEIEDLNDDAEAAADYVDYFDECLWVTPMTAYGLVANGDGYYYTNDGGASSFLVTALDFTEEGDNVAAWVFYDNCEDYETPLSSKRAMKVPQPISRSN